MNQQDQVENLYYTEVSSCRPEPGDLATSLSIIKLREILWLIKLLSVPIVKFSTMSGSWCAQYARHLVQALQYLFLFSYIMCNNCLYVLGLVMHDGNSACNCRVISLRKLHRCSIHGYLSLSGSTVVLQSLKWNTLLDLFRSSMLCVLRR